ncbi:hypothetical protein [Planctomicrobium sp. SH527]|uniref:hypothetical protein n=1 Tax=Planctomicrobium sp. SH527 TaxID=3448123 RepID=UPI003F5B10F3
MPVLAPEDERPPKAIAAMQEIGCDLTTHLSKGLQEFNDTKVDVAITMGCGDECPLVHAQSRVDWQILAPSDMTPDEFRAVRNLIKEKIKNLIVDFQ